MVKTNWERAVEMSEIEDSGSGLGRVCAFEKALKAAERRGRKQSPDFKVWMLKFFGVGMYQVIVKEDGGVSIDKHDALTAKVLLAKIEMYERELFDARQQGYGEN